MLRKKNSEPAQLPEARQEGDTIAYDANAAEKQNASDSGGHGGGNGGPGGRGPGGGF